MTGINFETPALAQDDLSNEAWDLAAEALRKGTLTLKSGKTIELQPREMLKHVQWVAALNKRKPKAFPRPKETHIRQTS